MGSSVRTESVASYFEANVRRPDNPGDCWAWVGPTTIDGYALMTYGGDGKTGRVYAYRFAYELYRDAIPGGLTIDHLCRNRACVNPSHLEAVTRGENARRAHLTPQEVEERRMSTKDEDVADVQADEPASQAMVPIASWDTEMPMAVDNAGSAFIPLRSLCIYLGISPDMQLKRIKEHPVIAKRLRRFVIKTRGGRQAVWCLDLKIVGFWLGSVSINHVRESLRAGLLEFQEDLATAAHDLLTRRANPTRDNLSAHVMTQDRQVASVTRFTLALEERIGRLEEHVFGGDE